MVQICIVSHIQMTFPRSTTRTEEFSTFLPSSNWLNKNCPRWNLFLFPEATFIPLIKVSTFQGWWRGAVQRCFPSFQQRRWRYFPTKKLQFESWLNCFANTWLFVICDSCTKLTMVIKPSCQNTIKSSSAPVEITIVLKRSSVLILFVSQGK